MFIIFLFQQRSISLEFYNNHPLGLLISFRLLMLLKAIVLYFDHNFKNFSARCFLRVSFSPIPSINRCWTTECIQIFTLFSISLNFFFNHLSSHSVCRSLSNLFQQMVQVDNSICHYYIYNQLLLNNLFNTLIKDLILLPQSHNEENSIQLYFESVQPPWHSIFVKSYLCVLSLKFLPRSYYLMPSVAIACMSCKYVSPIFTAYYIYVPSVLTFFSKDLIVSN